MQSPLQVMKIRTDNENYRAAIKTISAQLRPGNKPRTSQRVAKYILINYPLIMYAGKSYNTFSKSIGAGVHEIYLKEAKPT